MNWFCHCVTVAPWNCCHCPQVRGVEILQVEGGEPEAKGRRENPRDVTVQFRACACDYEDYHKYRA